MAFTPGSSQIGLRQLAAIENLPDQYRRTLLAEGMTLITRSARELVCAAAALTDHDRAADFLRRYGEEEAAKVLT